MQVHFNNAEVHAFKACLLEIRGERGPVCYATCERQWGQPVRRSLVESEALRIMGPLMHNPLLMNAEPSVRRAMSPLTRAR